MKIIYRFFFLFNILNSCQLSPPTPIDSPVDVLGVLNVDHVAEVSLKKIFRLGEPIDSTRLDIKDATLFLVENGIFFDSLTCHNDKVYRTNRVIKPNTNYVLKGVLKSGHTFYSNEVMTPRRPKLIKIQFFPEVQNPFSSSVEPVAEIKIDLTELEGNNLFFGVRPTPNISGENLQLYSNLFRVAVNQNSDCIISGIPTFHSEYQTFIRKSCLEINNSSFWFEKSLFKVVSSYPNFKVEKINFTNFLVSYGIVSDELYLYLEGSKPVGVERMNVDPSLSYSNFIGAQGVIFGQSEIEAKIP